MSSATTTCRATSSSATTATVERLDEMADVAAGEYAAAVARAAAGQEPHDDLTGLLVMAGRTFPEFKRDVRRAIDRQQARRDLERAGQLRQEASQAHDAYAALLVALADEQRQDDLEHATRERGRGRRRAAANEDWAALKAEAAELEQNARRVLLETISPQKLADLERQIKVAESQRDRLRDEANRSMTQRDIVSPERLHQIGEAQRLTEAEIRRLKELMFA